MVKDLDRNIRTGTAEVAKLERDAARYPDRADDLLEEANRKRAGLAANRELRRTEAQKATEARAEAAQFKKSADQFAAEAREKTAAATDLTKKAEAEETLADRAQGYADAVDHTADAVEAEYKTEVEILESTGQPVPFEPKLMPDEPAGAPSSELEMAGSDEKALMATAGALETEAGVMEEEAPTSDVTAGIAALDGDPDGEVVAVAEEAAPDDLSMDGSLDETAEAPVVEEPVEDTLVAQMDEPSETQIDEPDAVDSASEPDLVDDLGGELA